MARCFPFLSLTSFSSRCHKNAALIANAGAFADGGFPLLLLLARGLLGPPTAEHPRLHSPAPRALSLSDNACPPPCLLLEEEPSSSLPLPLRRESQQLNGDIRRKAEGAQALRLRPSPAPSSWLSGHRSTPTPLHHLSFPSSFLGRPVHSLHGSSLLSLKAASPPSAAPGGQSGATEAEAQLLS